MKTPKNYTKLLNENKITMNIIGEVLYSTNKRAKNWRDKKREYKNQRYDKYNNYEKALENEQSYYKMKSDILSKFEPVEFHAQILVKKYYEKVYDNDPDFFDLVSKGNDDIRSYYDYENDIEVQFIKVEKESKQELYFEYYKVGEYDFHQPIENVNGKVNIKYLGEDFQTEGKEITELLSVSFCKKVHELLMSNSLEISN